MTLARSRRESRRLHRQESQLKAGSEKNRRSPRHPNDGDGARSQASNGADAFTLREQRLHIDALENQLYLLHNSREELLQRVADLERSYDYYSTLFEQSPFGYVVLDLRGFVKQHNQAFASMVVLKSGYARIGPFARFVRRADLDKFLQHLNKAASGRKTVRTELSLRNTGEPLPVELITVRLEKPSAGGSTLLHTAVIDIRQRLAAEAALEKTQRNYQLLTNAIDAILWEADAETHRLSFVSGSAERCLGYPLAEWYRPDFWGAHIYFEDRDQVLNLLAHAIADRKDTVLEYRAMSADRRIVWMRDSVSMQMSEGRLKLFGVAVDITERKNAEMQLHAAQEHLETRVEERTTQLRQTLEDLEAFSYSLSHDMRAPLRAMQGYSQVLLHMFGEQLGPTGQDYLGRVMTSAERLDNLIRDVLNYTKVTRTPVELHKVDLDRLLDSIINDYPAFQPPNAELKIQRPLLPVLGNEAFLTQCFSNLLSNAVKFVSPGTRPRVRVWTRPAQTEVQVCVEDNGIGIRPEDQRRIFGIFDRVNASKQYEGTGIGLAIVNKAVERMGGQVSVESVPGKGTRFWLQLHSGV